MSKRTIFIIVTVGTLFILFLTSVFIFGEFKEFKGSFLGIKSKIFPFLVKPFSVEPLGSVANQPIILDSLLHESIPQEWIDQFNKNFKITFTPYLTCLYPKCDEEKANFTESEKNTLKNITYRAIYVASRIDSYFKKPLPYPWIIAYPSSPPDAKTYYKWLKGALKTIIYSSNPSVTGSAPSASTSGVLQLGAAGGSILLDGKGMLKNAQEFGLLDKWYDKQTGLDSYAFIEIITHEARHNNLTYSHSSCRNGFYMMDKNLRTVGPHGVNVVFKHWMKYLLPKEIVEEATKKYGENLFDYSGGIDRMCSLTVDPITGYGKMDPEDLKWVKNVSGYDLDFDPKGPWSY